MNAVQVLAAIKQCAIDAKGDAHVYWIGEEIAWQPADATTVELSVTTFVDEADPRLTEDDTAGTTVMSTPYVFTVRMLASDLRNDGSALSELATLWNRLELPTYRETWYANGIAIVDRPLSPVNLGRTADGRHLAQYAADVRFRAVLSDTITLTSGIIESVSGEGTLTPGDIPVPFEVN